VPELNPSAILLEDRVALVTGAAAGIGAATATMLARFGCDVAICDRDLEGLAATTREIESVGRRAFAEIIDVRDHDAVEHWVASSVAALGRLDIVVNNAGGGFVSDFLDLTTNGQAALLAENFTSVTSVIRAAVPHLPEGGSIVNVTSIEAHRAAPGFAVYASMKAAVLSLTRSLSLELSPRGIRVNCVAPDVIPTPGVGMLEAARSGATARGEALQPSSLDGHPDDVAAAIVWLAGGMARFVTGTTVHVDGGTSAAAGWKRRTDGAWAL